MHKFCACFFDGFPYNPHLTQALLEADLPEAIKGDVNEEWRKKIVGDFLDMKVLNGAEVILSLIDEKLEHWDMTISSPLQSLTTMASVAGLRLSTHMFSSQGELGRPLLLVLWWHTWSKQDMGFKK